MQTQQATAASMEFAKAFDEKSQKTKKPVILICGFTGSGKTSLLQGIFGKELIGDHKISNGTPCTQTFDFYENNLLKVYDSKGIEPGESEEVFARTLKRHIEDLRASANVDNHIHLSWYTLQGAGARVSEGDLSIISTMPEPIIILTKSDIAKPKTLQAMRNVLEGRGIPGTDIIEVGNTAPNSEIMDSKALVKLYHRSCQKLPAAYREAFDAAQLVDLDKKRSLAGKFIHGAAGAAASAAFIPIPVSDSIMIAPIQIGMIGSLAYVYGLSKETAIASTAQIVTQAAGITLATTLTKLIPGVGSIICGTVAGTLTEALGWVVQKYLEKCAIAKRDGLPMPEFVIPSSSELENLTNRLCKKQEAVTLSADK